jgi:hypothetical protein
MYAAFLLHHEVLFFEVILLSADTDRPLSTASFWCANTGICNSSREPTRRCCWKAGSGSSRKSHVTSLLLSLLLHQSPWIQFMHHNSTWSRRGRNFVAFFFTNPPASIFCTALWWAAQNSRYIYSRQILTPTREGKLLHNTEKWARRVHEFRICRRSAHQLKTATRRTCFVTYFSGRVLHTFICSNRPCMCFFIVTTVSRSPGAFKLKNR